MSYLCKDCDFNNNGWCNKRKMQKLKEVKECTFKEIEGVQVCGNQESLEKEDNSEAYKNFGRRDFFYNMQRQIIAMELKGETSISLDELKLLMVGLDQTLKISEALSGIKFDYMIDQDIFNNSNKIIEKWEVETKK